MVKVKFREPVTGVFSDSLVLEKQSGSSWSAVPARWLSSSGPVAVSQRLHTIFIIPTARLEVGGRYRVRGTEAIVDFDTPPKKLTQAPVEFQVANYTEIGTFPIPDEMGIVRVATIGGRTFAASPRRIYLIRAGGATTAPAVRFGVTAEDDFMGQTVQEMKVFRQVPVLGSLMDLLVVTTQPQPGDSDHQAGLWVFNACNANPVPKLMFGMSIGAGAWGYAPNVDCAGGFITVGRLVSSIAVVSVDKGVLGWGKPDPLTGRTLTPADVISPGGANQKALVQPIYLVNPVDGWDASGVAMLPGASGPTGGLGLVVGYPGGGARDGKPMRGLPTAILPADANGVLIPQAPYIPASGVSAEHAGPLEPDARAFPGPFPGPLGGSATRVSVLPNLTTRLPDGTTAQVSLALGVSLRPSGFGGDSLAILNEARPEAPVFLGTWPTAPLGTDAAGSARAYKLPRVTPSVDPITHLVALPVKFTDTGKIEWFVLDFSVPAAPRTLARVPATGQYGSFNNGILAVQAPGGLKLLKIVDGVPGVDEGTCERLVADVGIAMDGNRNGEDRIDFDDTANAHYLFWVNDDYDATSWKRDDLPTQPKSLVEDDEQEGAAITVGTGMGQHTMTVVRNCDDDVINGKRDLEDFTRIHLKVDDHTTSLSNVTYWMKFENVVASGSPSVNIFEAVDGTINYLKNESIADQQILKTKLKTIGSSEVQLLNQYIKSGGLASPFILEGKSKGEGDLTLIVRLGGIELGRKSVHLEIKSITEFVEKFKVTTTTDSGDQVQTTAVPDPRPYTYAPSDHPELDDYVLFVHGWNMGEWEKDRWLETVFKRLWWKGYKGRVGGFQWPTLEGVTTYDQSDLRAWRSGQALSGLLTGLNTSHPGKVRVIAHSMGNIVMGEALRSVPANTPPLVHTYIAAQAAVPAHCYDNSLPETASGIKTPNVYGHYYDGEIDRPYFGENSSKVGNLIQYFNSKDFALAGWDFNNKHKPDIAYFYEDFDGINTYHPAAGDRFSFVGDSTGTYRYLFFPDENKGTDDRFEIFARCAQSRTRALGTIDLVNHLNVFGVRRNLKEELGFDDKHYSHSREFRSNIAKEWSFWRDVGKDFDLLLPVQQ